MRNAMAGEDGAERTQACLLFTFVGRCVEGFSWEVRKSRNGEKDRDEDFIKL